jgi:hypothetical protein
MLPQHAAMDRHAFLDALPYLRPCSRDTLPDTPVWVGCASFSLSLDEQFGEAHAAQNSPLDASSEGVEWLWFAVSEASQDGTQLRAELHVGAAGEAVFVLDGRAYAVNGPAIRHVSARVPDNGALPPYVKLLFARVALTLVPAHGRAWAVEAPLLLAAANVLERARAVVPAASQAPTAEDAAALAADAETALLRWREAAGALAAAVTAPMPAGIVVQSAAATELLGAAAVTLRGAADAGAIAGVCTHAKAELDAALAAAYPASHVRADASNGAAEERLTQALARMDASNAAALAAALAPS